MESPEKPVDRVVYTHITKVLETGGPHEDGTYWFTTMGRKFWVMFEPDLAPGDRVKITITKEPADAQP